MSNSKLHYLNELDETKDFWNVKVRIIKRWDLKWRLDVILIDENGNKMQGFVKEKLMPDFDASLQEDTVVIIKGCGVGAQEDKFPVLDTTKKIIFYKSTEVQPAVGWTGHPYGFHFKKLEEISDKMMGKGVTVDVIGNISWCGNMDCFKNSLGKETKRLHLDLQNLEGTVLRCTFWGDFAVQVANHIDNHGSSMEQIILIVQHGKVKNWAETLTVQNDMFGTRLFLDNDLKDINDFRRSLILKQGGHGNSQSMITTQTNYPMRNEFIVNADRKTIEDVREIKLTPGINQDPKLPLKPECIVLCTIKLLEEDAGWFYAGCRTCKKKVKPKAEYLREGPKPHADVQNAAADSLWCPKCNCLATSVIPKFRIQFRVQDPTGCVSLLMFDQEVTRLTGLSATDIRERQLKSVDHNSYPHELDVLLNRQLAFKIVVTEYNVRQKYYNYTVNRVCNDPDIIDEMRGDDAATQCTPEPANAEASCVKLSQSSQGGVDSKDAASVTGGCLAVDGEKDEATSPLLRRPTKKVLDSVVAEADTSTSKRLKLKMETANLIKKLEPYDE